MPPQPPASQDSGESGARIREAAHSCTLEEFCSRLDTCQIEGELVHLFRESPEFGQVLSKRLARFLPKKCDGPLALIAAGGEAAIFGDDRLQQVIKLSGPPATCEFGWTIVKESDGRLNLNPGSINAVLARLALFEALFPTGLSVEAVAADGSFLLVRQPFIVGTHPTVEELDQWMRREGWEKIHPPSHGRTLNSLTWSKARWVATDVRPENVIQCEADRQLYPIDFIVGGSEVA
jgi:hypothetical protein